MLFQKKQTRKRAPSRYVQKAFQGKVVQASKYQRKTSGFSRNLQLFSAAYAQLPKKLILGVCVACAGIGLVLFYPKLFFVQQVEVSGLPEQWSPELQGQIARFVSEKRFAVIPGQNLLTLDSVGLQAYIPTVNTHVAKVVEIKKQWPRGLIVTVLPRVPAYAWSILEQTVVVSNDGRILPANEVSAAAALVPVSGDVGVAPVMGEEFVSGQLLSALEGIRTDFVRTSGVTGVAAVKVVPLLPEQKEDDQVSSAASLQVAVPEYAPAVLSNTTRVVSYEIHVLTAPDSKRGVPQFTVYLDAGVPVQPALEKLGILLEKQPLERLRELVYVDMRFAARAYICVRSASCATTAR